MGTHVRLLAWRNGLNKVELNHLLRRHGRVGLADAKQKVDDLLLGQSVTIDLGTAEAAHAFAEQASLIGAVCEVVGVGSKD